MAEAQALKDARAKHQVSVPSTAMPVPSDKVEQVTQNKVVSLTPGIPEQASLPAVPGTGDQSSQSFSSIASNLGSRISAKIKAKAWANKYIDFGATEIEYYFCTCTHEFYRFSH